MNLHLANFRNRTIAWIGALAFAAAAAPAMAAPVYQSVNLDYAQTGLVISDAAPGFRLWDVSASATNNTGSALGDANFWLLGLLLNTGNGLIDAAWNNTTKRFETGGAGAAPDNNTAFLQFGLSDLTAPPTSLITGADQLGVWELGPMAVGQTVNFHWQIMVDAAVTEIRPNTGNYIGFTNTVPEPTGLGLTALALLAAGVVARRRQVD